MRESIYTIPIGEVFEPREGCPLCRMRNMLEERALEYTMGAAMMEPDVRIETNKRGFCEAHFRDMLASGNRLSVGLMLQSHLGYIREEILLKKASPIGRDSRSALARAVADGCFVCERIDDSMSRMTDTVLTLWGRDEEFRLLFSQQELLCLPHFARFYGAAGEKKYKKQSVAFTAELCRLAEQGIAPVAADIDSFCNLFDYRAKKDEVVPREVKISPERAAELLTSRKFVQVADK